MDRSARYGYPGVTKYETFQDSDTKPSYSENNNDFIIMYACIRIIFSAEIPNDVPMLSSQILIGSPFSQEHCKCKLDWLTMEDNVYETLHIEVPFAEISLTFLRISIWKV